MDAIATLGAYAPDGAGKLMGAALSATIASPFTVMRTLVQLGHEPIPAKKHVNFLGQKGYIRPGLVRYGTELVRVNGYGALLIGLDARIVESLVCDAVVAKTRKFLAPNPKESEDDDEDPAEIVKAAAVDTVALCTGVLVSHPFRVVGINMVAQIVGGEKVFDGLFSGLRRIYDTEGASGLFKGIVPALISEAIWAVSMAALTRMMTKYVTPKLLGEFSDEEQRAQQSASAEMVSRNLAAELANPLFYPFKVVRTIMIVQGTGLAASRPPTSNVYLTWTDCFADLRRMPMHRGLLRSIGLRRFAYEI